jgi:PAS domain S-box-containing protein
MIYPNEIKFLFRYGNFLLEIIHNEFDAVESFNKAQMIFLNKMNKKGASAPVNEQSIFGENSAAGIIVMSCNSTTIGTIVHCNEEVESVTNYQKTDLVGKNVTLLMPRNIAKAHDKLVQRYFETAKPTVIEIKRCLLVKRKEGYLKEIELIVKVFPQIDDQIIFVGFLQHYDSFDDMEPVKPEYERFDKQYIITDTDGNITNVTEGLSNEMGLNAKFFNYTDSIFQQMFNIQKICPQIFEDDNTQQDSLE